MLLRPVAALLISLPLTGCNNDPPPPSGGGSTSETSAETETASDSTAADVSDGADTTDGSDTSGDPACNPANQPPNTPQILAPLQGTRNIEPQDIIIQSSAFADPNGDPHAASEFQIWRVNQGVPVERVWSATTTEGIALEWVALEHGALEGTAEAAGTLELWQNHVVRVRHSDGSEGDCAWSEWSEDADFRTDDGSAYLFDQTVIRDIYLEIPPDSWDAIDAEATPPGCVPWQREYHEGTLTFEGQEFQGIGLRSKGGCGSARNLDGKAAFRINLGWDDPSVPGCPETQRLFGQKHLTLNNMVQDETYSHDRLAYRVYDAFGVPTPRVAHIRVHVNDEYWGLYLLVETPKRRFLDRRFESKNGMLYEGTYLCDLIPDNVPPGDEDTYCLEAKFSEGRCDGMPADDADPQNYDLLRDMVDELDALSADGFYPEIENVFNFDTFLSAWAVEGAVGHWDNYSFSIMNNYRVYHHPTTDLWNLLPHGVDQTFEVDVNPWSVSAVIPEGCLDYPACEAEFAARFAEAGEAIESLDLLGELDVISELITEEVYADPRKEFSNNTYDFQQDLTREWIEDRPDRVLELLIEHGF